MIKNQKFSYDGMKKDLSKSIHPYNFYFDAQHIKIISTDTQSTGKITNEKGNSKILFLPSININKNLTQIIYGDKFLSYSSNGNSEIDLTLPDSSENQIIIGHVATRDSIILFSTDNNGFDCIWEIKNFLSDVYNFELIYCRNLNFSTENPIQSIFNYENSKLQKIYWVDSNNQLRFLNKEHSIKNGDLENLIDLNSNSINIVSNFKLSQINIDGFSGGGIHTSGMIQYAYNLYRLNGSQTVISPLSKLVPLSKGENLGGGEINEIVGTIPTINIPNLDKEYTHIKIYAIKYTSFKQIPSISIIVDSEIDNYNNYIFNDDGNKINDISLDTFLFLGSNPVIPKHIESKDNILFVSNTKELNFDIDFDSRAYSFNSAGISKIKINNQSNEITLPNQYLDKNILNYNLKTDMVNPNYEIYKFQDNGNVLGGTGKFISYNLDLKSNINNVKNLKFFKSNEIYRIGIEFYNILGQVSLPKWISDFKTPFCNLNNLYSNLSIKINSEGITHLKSLGVVGYRVLRVERKESDRTIICQGMLNGMMFQDTNEPNNYSRFNQYHIRKESSENNLKIPNHLVRHFDNNLRPMRKYSHLSGLKHNNRSWDSEFYDDTDINYKRSHTFQFNRMYQLYSPDILFSNPGLSSNLNFQILGLHKSSNQNFWGQQRNTNTKNIELEAKAFNKISVFAPGGNTTQILGSPTHLQDFSMIGPSSTNDSMDFYQYYREYIGGFIKSNNNNIYNIYGIPEITERGAERTLYNNDNKLAYSNSFKSIITDDAKNDGEGSGAIVSTNSYGNKCLTFVQGNNDSNIDMDNRKSLSQLKSETNISETDGILICDIRRNLTNQYGGNSYESKSRNLYIKISDYISINDINESIENIENHGDIFIQDFEFLRVNKTDTEVYNSSNFQWTEIVKFKVETSIDLKNRNDTSFNSWDSRFQPREDEYHRYNKVYSQESTLIQSQDVSFKFKKINEFDTRIMSSKIKIYGEFIDSWTDFLENEIIDLDGKYGSINGLVNYKDEIFSLQDEAISKIIINPRVQIQSSDNLSIELGKGSILYDYQYITNTSGTINKWSVFKSPTGFYYFDALNKSINKYPEAIEQGLTDIKFLHTEFENNFDYNLIKLDNPILKTGVNGGFDLLNNDAYMTLHQGDKSITICYNEFKKEFIDFKKYYPSQYINKGYKFLIPNLENNSIYEQGKGEYNKFFDEYIPSYITLMVNPESDLDKVFNNITYKSEVYLDDIDQSNITLSTIQAFNEYQNTGVVPLILGRNTNLRRKFRDWKAIIPRENNNRNRIRNPWIFLKLEFNNIDNYKLILHDIIVHYSV